MFFLLIIVLVILISTCDVLCEAHNRWPYGYDRDAERYKVILGFVGEMVTMRATVGMAWEMVRMEEEAMGGGSGDDGETILIIDSTKYLGY